MASSNQFTVKTSLTHPLQIAELQPMPGGGRIGVTFCPGKKQHNAMTGRWARDLGADLDHIREWGADTVLTLVEPHELDALGVRELGEEVRRRHMVWHHLPIADFGVPDTRFERVWAQVAPSFHRQLRYGFRILVHCKGGLGRAGTVAARLMTELGMEPLEAIAAVRAVRPGAIETRAQEQHVLDCKPKARPAPLKTARAIEDRGLGALVGLAVGDALGTTLEFRRRDRYDPLTDMVGGGPFQLQPGQWTDDTALALALADSLIECDALDERDLMQRFLGWREEGRYSCTGTCFDIGITTSDALSRFQRTGQPVAGCTKPTSAGNGSLMRLAPVALKYWQDRERLRDAAHRQGHVTHGASASIAACTAFADMLADAIAGHTADEMLDRAMARAGQVGDTAISAVVAGSWRGKTRKAIRSSGYVVHSLEAALWCVGRSHSFADAVLTAANLGEDADTTAAIAGQLAGALYGLSAIPSDWLEKLAWRERILAAGRCLIRQA